MIKTFEQFINEADEIILNLEKPEAEETEFNTEIDKLEVEKPEINSNAELEIILNIIDKNKNLRELLKFLRHSTSALTIKCIDDETKKQTEFKWNGHKDDSILFLDVTDLDNNKIEDDDDLEEVSTIDSENQEKSEVEELEDKNSVTDFEESENSFE